MRIYSWNVNGLRAAESKGFSRWLAASEGEIVGVQEARASLEQVPEALRAAPGRHLHLVAGKKAGYSGVALFSRREPDDVETTLHEPRFDDEGRLQLARYGKLVVANVYFPNGNGKDRDNSRIPYKLDFYRALFERLERLRRGRKRVLVMGDFNTAHREIDIARPKENETTSGFTPIERAELDRWIDAGWIDTFRRYEAGPGHYSWWSQRFGVRAKNIGWRLDMILASPAAMEHVRAAAIHPQVLGSDHCPVSVEVDDAILG